MIYTEFPPKKQKMILCILTGLLDSEHIKTTLNNGGICSVVFDDIFAASMMRWGHSPGLQLGHPHWVLVEKL